MIVFCHKFCSNVRLCFEFKRSMNESSWIRNLNLNSGTVEVSWVSMVTAWLKNCHLLPVGNEVLLWSILTDSGAHKWILGTLSLEVKKLVCWADHSPVCSAEVKNEWSYTSTHHVFMACRGTAWPLVFTEITEEQDIFEPGTIICF